MDARLYLILAPRSCRGSVAETVRAAVTGGVDLIQLRDKTVADERFVKFAQEIVPICRERNVPLILNDRVHLVARLGAAGVHLGEEDFPPEEARRLLGPDVLIGLSTHDREEVQAAAGRGADYVGLGPMFPTVTKTLTRSPKGAALVRAVQGATHLPLFPIGGIGPENVADLVEAGATRIAVSSAICAAPDPEAAARALRAALPG
ncbi:MAG: thiamine phosphate synthase [Planctomycetota bacterium]